MNQKIVLITGTSAGLGKSTAEKLLHEGCTVYAAARRVEKMRELEAKGAHLLEMDVTDDAQVEAGVARIIDEQGRIDVLLGNAGYGSYGTVECIPLEEIRHQYDVNVFGVARVLKAVLPHMRERRSGRIIVTASVVGHISTAMIGWYASTKHALEAMCDALRMEVKHLGIDVVIIEPGAVKTEFDTVAFATLDRIEHPDDYKTLASAFRKFSENVYAKSPGPEGTARAVAKAIKANRPKLRYATTLDAKLAPRVRRWLGDRIFDRIVLSQFR